MPDRAIGPPIGLKLRDRAGNEGARIFNRPGVVHPGQPRPEMGAVALRHLKKRRRIAILDLPDFDFGRYPKLKHHEIPPGICGLRDFEIEGVSGVSGCMACSVSPFFSISKAVGGSSAYWKRFRSSGEIIPCFTSASKLMISFQ